MFTLLRWFACCGCLCGLGIVTKDLAPVRPNRIDLDRPKAFSTHRAIGAVLLARADVQCELGIDDQQSRDVHEWLRAIRDHACDQFPKPHDIARYSGAHDRVYQEDATDFINQEIEHSEIGLAEVLNAKQLERLQQIRLQREGIRVFDRSEIIDRLCLTEVQRQRIGELSPFAMTPYASAKVSEKCHSDLYAILTIKQRDAWLATIGEIFLFDHIGPCRLEYEVMVALTGVGPLH